MGFTWEPADGDGSSMSGPVRFSYWMFTSDFIYGERPDVEVYMISLQMANITGVDSQTAVSGSSWDYQPPRVVVEGIEERNSQRRRERRQRRPREVSEDEDDDDLPDSQNRSRRGRRRRRNSSFPGEGSLSLTRPPVSSALSPPPRSILRSTSQAISTSAGTTNFENIQSQGMVEGSSSISNTASEETNESSAATHVLSAADIEENSSSSRRPVRSCRRRSARLSEASETEEE